MGGAAVGKSGLCKFLQYHVEYFALIPLPMTLRSAFATGLLLSLATAATAQPVTVGAGSYATTLPSGAVGPRQANGQNAVPKVSSTFSKPVQTNDFWSSLIFPFYNDPHSNNLYAHPALFRARNNGLQIGYTASHVFAANDYLYPYTHQLTVGVSGLTATRTTTEDYSDWTVTALWEGGGRRMKALIGHGLPYAFFAITGGNAVVTPAATPVIWHNSNGVVGMTVSGRHYGLFAPHGSVWTGTSTLESSLNGKDYLSVALLPDNTPATLEFFRKRAYAFVTEAIVEWSYDEETANLRTTYRYETVLKEDLNGNLPNTMTALYRHQWLHTSDPLTAYTYQSPRGLMKLFDGNRFTTDITHGGILPGMPDLGTYNRADLLAMVRSVANEALGTGPSYENGKAMGRFARLVNIADQLGATAERDQLIAKLKIRLQDWLTAGGAQQYMYNATWDVLTGYPSGYGADDQINDHSFHSGYAIMSAAIVAQFDPEWAAPERWGGMVNLLIKDSNNWDRTDTRFPFLRGHDAYAGHSWAAGHGDFGDGNNQESSSESMHFAAAVTLWGAVTGQKAVRDLGIFLHATERTAVEQYWFDVDNAVFPANYPHVAIGMVWGGKGVHSTWFGAAPEFIHGINILPITGGSLYLGRHPHYVLENYAEIVKENSGQPDIWQDVLWQFLALADPDQALSFFLSNPGYPVFDGESRAHTYHWIGNLKRMGQVDTTVTASIPTYAVFRDKRGERSYVAFNPTADSLTVRYSDGFSFRVGPRKLSWESLSSVDPDAPVVLLVADLTIGKSPLTVRFEGGRSYDPNGEPLTYIWDFGDGGTSAAANPTHVFTAVREHTVRLTVTNQTGLRSVEEVLIRVLGNGTPYRGAAFAVPGRLEAEHYDLGGEGVAYHDVDANNIGLAFRPNEGVDLEGANDGGFDVYWMVAGEWLEYTISVPSDGMYDIIPYVTTVPGFGNFRIRIDNADVSGRRNVTGTGGWQNWTAIPVLNVPMTAGTRILRFEIDSDSDKRGWLFSLNYFLIRASQGTSVDEAADHPERLDLDANYPNPFNPATNIRFALPEAMHVHLEVYSADGRLVATLVDAPMTVGTHQVRFDGENVASGLYLYRLTTPNGILTRKMTLVK